MEVLKIKVLLIKKWKWSGEDEESEDGEEEAEGSRSVSTLIFELSMCLKGMDLHGRDATNIPRAKCQHSTSMWKVQGQQVMLHGLRQWPYHCHNEWEDHLAVHPSHPANAPQPPSQCSPATQPMLTTPPMDPATPAEMEEEGNEDPITMIPTPSPPCKKAHHIQVRMPSPLTLAPGPVPSTSMSTSHLAPAGGSTSTTALAALPTLVQPCQPGAYMLVDTFQQVLMWDHMTGLEHKMTKMTSNMHHWWDDIVAKYLELNQCIRTMEDNQHKFIR
ncbi:hypothetical protein ID866_12217, partial [Astraeus odoratus]